MSFELIKEEKVIIKIDDEEFEVYPFYHEEYPGVKFNPMFCSLCFTIEGEFLYLNPKTGECKKNKNDFPEGTELYIVGKEWYYTKCYLALKERKDKPICTCRHENLQENCKYWKELLAQIEGNKITV